MKVVALCQAYQEELFIRRNLTNVYPFVDQIIISEGCLSPHGELSVGSTDRTFDEIAFFISEQDHADKIKFIPGWSMADRPPDNRVPPSSREEWEGLNKNKMLAASDIEDGDLIYILDCDEFLQPHRIEEIISYFKEEPGANCVRLKEQQFAYGLKWWFPSTHPRFFRYRKAGRFGNTNHFFHLVGAAKQKLNITSRHNREFDGLFHLCWSKHPLQIREKVVSFKRTSFTRWFNTVYLEWADDPASAYANNKKIPPYHGSGFTEGMHECLREFEGELPAALDGLELDWIEFVRKNKGSLTIS